MQLQLRKITDCMVNNVAVELLADDAKIYKMYTAIDEVIISSNQMQLSLDLVAAWADYSQLKLYPLKYSVMRLTGNRLTSHIGPSYTVGTHTFPIVFQCTDLSVSYDYHINFK